MSLSWSDSGALASDQFYLPYYLTTYLSHVRCQGNEDSLINCEAAYYRQGNVCLRKAGILCQGCDSMCQLLINWYNSWQQFLPSVLTVEMVMWDFKAHPVFLKDVLKCVSTMPGEQYVMMAGVLQMEMFSVHSWASSHLVSKRESSGSSVFIHSCRFCSKAQCILWKGRLRHNWWTHILLWPRIITL